MRARILRWLGHRRWFAAAGRRFGAPLDRRLVEVWPAHETYRARSGKRHTFVLEPQSRE